ncbi:hypothetical protein Ae201684P_011945 [Aphanomyces euteiches]|nr:hypothetical protein Ae201684_011525 [Aphanomyces euteiches]KAH9097224.1 hypothetical protein Ae201684P_011945 [Aphanomyces euteiches]
MSRLKMYAESSFEVTDEILEHVADQGILLKVARIESHKFDKTRDCYYMLVHWEGFEAIEASWEDVTQLLRDCPDVYVEALKPGRDREQLASRIKSIQAKLKA